MARPRFRFLSVLLLSAAAALCARLYLPSTPVDRALFEGTIRSFANPPFIISGNGSRATPWALRLTEPSRKADPAKAPIIVSIGDDPDGIFQSSPPSPLDLAIVLKNIRRLGHSEAAISAVLSWEEPTPIDLAALDSELSKFSTLVTAAPLSRATTTTALPPSFRRASIPLDQISGDLSPLPVVNRISLPGVILGGNSALSGFTVLEQEPATGTPLIARWEDRAVFAFPLLAVLAQSHLPIDGVEIDLGNFIKLSPTGPIIAIDSGGRLAASAGKLAGEKTISADTLIDTEQPLPVDPNRFVLVRDDQSAAEFSTREFSRNVSPLIAGISSGAGMSSQKIFRRVSEPWEIGILSAIAVLLAAFATRPRFPREIGFGLIAALVIAAHLISASAATLWLPTLAAIAAVLTALLFSRIFFRETLPIASPAIIPAPEKISEPIEPPPAPEPQESLPPAPKPKAKKSPPAKKSAAKKARPRKKSPPGNE